MSDDAARRLEHENKALHVRLESLEREKSLVELQRRTLVDEKAVLKEQLETAVAAERRKNDETRGEWTAVVQQHAADVRRLRQENENLRRTNEMLTDETSKRVNGSEVNNVRLSAQIAQLQKELSTKDNELATSLKEAQFMRDNLERVVKELVDRNRRTDEEAKRRSSQHEKDLSDLLAEHQRRIAEVGEMRRELQQSKEDRQLLDAQVAHGKQLNKELTDDIDSLRNKVLAAEAAFEEVQHEAKELRRQEEDMRADIDELLGKLGKADGHIQRLTDEASTANLTALKLRHQLELAEDDCSVLRRDKEELLRRLTPLLRAAGDQVDTLAATVDQVLSATAQEAAQENGYHSSHTSNAKAVQFKCWPDALSGATAGTSASPDDSGAPSVESQLLMCALRLRDVTSLIGEDLSLVQRSVADAHHRLREALRREAVLDDTFKAERAHVLELATRAGDLEAEISRSEEQRKTIERTLVESSQWMSEAVAMGEERTRRVEMLVAERTGLEEKLHGLNEQLREAHADSAKHQRDADVARAELSRLSAEVQQGHRLRAAVDSELQAARATVQQLKQHIAEKDATEQRAKHELAARRAVEERADTETRVQRRLAEDAATRAVQREKELDEAEAREQKLRDQLYESQKRLDSALRRPASALTSGSVHSTMQQPSFASQPSPVALRSSPPASTSIIASPHRGHPVATPIAASSAPSALNTHPSASNLVSRGPVPALSASAAHRYPSSSLAAATSPRTLSPPRSHRQSPPSSFSLTASEAASTEKLRAWEAKINSMLQSSRASA